MNRIAAIVLLVCFLGLGSGALNYLHQMQHVREDAIVDAKLRAAGLPVFPHRHDDCQLCVMLHMQYIAGGWTPLLICLGLFVAFLTQLDKPLISRLAPVRIDCRGPPRI